MTSTNYFNVLIEVSEDTKATRGEVPPERSSGKTIANLEFEMLIDQPYQYTSDDVIFAVFAQRNNIPKNSMKREREQFFSQGRACFRTSPLAKAYGWGIHSNEEGKIALVSVGSDHYQELRKNKSVLKTKAMRSRKKPT